MKNSAYLNLKFYEMSNAKNHVAYLIFFLDMTIVLFVICNILTLVSSNIKRTKRQSNKTKTS
jgi:hypothetical protein